MVDNVLEVPVRSHEIILQMWILWAFALLCFDVDMMAVDTDLNTFNTSLNDLDLHVAECEKAKILCSVSHKVSVYFQIIQLKSKMDMFLVFIVS